MTGTPYDTNTLGPSGECDIPDADTLFRLLAEHPTAWTINRVGAIRSEPDGYCPLCWIATKLGKNPRDVKTATYLTNLFLPWKLRNTLELAIEGFIGPCCDGLRRRFRTALKPRKIKGGSLHTHERESDVQDED